jgi:hypothetical protein
MLLFFNCHLLPSVLYSAPIILLLSVLNSLHPNFRPAFPTRIQVSHPDFDRGFLTQIFDPDFDPDFRISNHLVPNPDFDPDFRARFPDFKPGSEPGFLTRISEPVFDPDFRPGFPTRISGFQTLFRTRISDPDF